jgi:hypothetical protein
MSAFAGFITIFVGVFLVNNSKALDANNKVESLVRSQRSSMHTILPLVDGKKSRPIGKSWYVLLGMESGGEGGVEREVRRGGSEQGSETRAHQGEADGRPGESKSTMSCRFQCREGMLALPALFLPPPRAPSAPFWVRATSTCISLPPSCPALSGHLQPHSPQVVDPYSPKAMPILKCYPTTHHSYTIPCTPRPPPHHRTRPMLRNV